MWWATNVWVNLPCKRHRMTRTLNRRLDSFIWSKTLPKEYKWSNRSISQRQRWSSCPSQNLAMIKVYRGPNQYPRSKNSTAIAKPGPRFSGSLRARFNSKALVPFKRLKKMTRRPSLRCKATSCRITQLPYTHLMRLSASCRVWKLSLARWVWSGLRLFHPWLPPKIKKRLWLSQAGHRHFQSSRKWERIRRTWSERSKSLSGHREPLVSSYQTMSAMPIAGARVLCLPKVKLSKQLNLQWWTQDRWLIIISTSLYHRRPSRLKICKKSARIDLTGIFLKVWDNWAKKLRPSTLALVELLKTPSLNRNGLTRPALATTCPATALTGKELSVSQMKRNQKNRLL